MGTSITLIALIAVMPFSSTTMKGSEANQQLHDFEAKYQADVKASGKRINVGEYRKAVVDKANELLKDVDLTAVPGSEGRDWAHILESANRIPDAISQLDKFVATNPAPSDLFDARVEQARDDLQIKKPDDAAKIAGGLTPSDDMSAKALAVLDYSVGTTIGKSDFDGGMKFFASAKTSFKGYETVAGPILKSGENMLIGPKTQESLVGQVAPELTIMSDKYGNFTNIAGLKGKVVILDFFAHWCPPCKASMPDMRALSDELGDKLQVVGVTSYYGTFGSKQNVPQSEEYADMKGFMDQYKIDHPVVYVDKGEFSKYGVTGIPEFVLIGKDGKVLKVKVGYSKDWFVDFRKAAEEAAK